VALLLAAASPLPAAAHGFAGKRFFPTTFAIEDPFVADELSFLVSHVDEPARGDEPGVSATELAAELSKRITPHLGISFAGEFRHLDPRGEPSASGFGNLELGAKYQFLTSERHEAVASLGLAAEVGDTGDPAVEAESFSVISPGLFFGKGFGDLPDGLRLLRPFAITGLVAANIPTDASTATSVVDPGTGALTSVTEPNPISLHWGFALEYNLHYLHAFVEDVGLPAMLQRIVPVLEVALDTCLDRGCGGETTGMVNPGLIWFGRTVQLGIAARIPINGRTGDDVGVFGLVHVFMDDLLPDSFGAPLFQ